jgi:hypothetical protein
LIFFFFFKADTSLLRTIKDVQKKPNSKSQSPKRKQKSERANHGKKEQSRRHRRRREGSGPTEAKNEGTATQPQKKDSEGEVKESRRHRKRSESSDVMLRVQLVAQRGNQRRRRGRRGVRKHRGKEGGGEVNDRAKEGEDVKGVREEEKIRRRGRPGGRGRCKAFGNLIYTLVAANGRVTADPVKLKRTLRKDHLISLPQEEDSLPVNKREIASSSGIEGILAVREDDEVADTVVGDDVRDEGKGGAQGM